MFRAKNYVLVHVIDGVMLSKGHGRKGVVSDEHFALKESQNQEKQAPSLKAKAFS